MTVRQTSGMTLTEAQDLLDWLENQGSALPEGDEGPLLLSDQQAREQVLGGLRLALSGCERLVVAHGERCDCALCLELGGMHSTLHLFCRALESPGRAGCFCAAPAAPLGAPHFPAAAMIDPR